MRIVSGEHRGRKLTAPRGSATRPTLGRARQVLFDILTPMIPDARVLDLYAGTGALGLEALSRGARLAVFVERKERAAHTLRQNLHTLSLEGRARVVGLPVRRALALLHREETGFDLILADPPYGTNELARLAGWLEQWPELLNKAGCLITQQHHKQPPAAPNYVNEVRRRRVGDTQWIVYRRDTGIRS